jgi:hypothetical protein
MQMIADADLFAKCGSIFGPHVLRPRLVLMAFPKEKKR